MARGKRQPEHCVACGQRLTWREMKYYEFRCEACESQWHRRVENWRLGGEDKALDRSAEAGVISNPLPEGD